MPISSVNRIKTVANQMNTGDGSIITIYENTGLTVNDELIPDHEIVSFNCFIKNLRIFALIKSLDEISLPNFTLDDSETDKLYKTLNTEWGSARKQITMYISNQAVTSANGDGWFKVGSLSLLNPSGYPYRIYNLMDLFTDGLAIELGDNGKIGAQIEDVGFGLLDSTDEVVIHGSYIEEIFVRSPDLIYSVPSGNGNTDPTPTPTPTPFPIATIFRLSASNIELTNNQSVDIWEQTSSSDLIVSQDNAENRPILKTNVLNGKNAVFFESVAARFLTIKNSVDNTPLSLIPTVGDWAIFSVAKIDDPTSVVFSSFISDLSPKPLLNIGGNYSNLGYYNAAAEFTLLNADYFSNGEWRIYILVRNGNLINLYINGDLFALGEIEGAIAPNKDYLDSAFIGCNHDSSNHLSGYVADIGIVNNSTTANINAIGQYFKSLYNLTWTNL